MSWEVGLNPVKTEFESGAVNEEILGIKGYLEFDKAQYELYRFLRSNPTYAMQLLFGVNLFPFQHLIVKGILECDYSLMVLSRGLSKTYSTAIALMLMACLEQGIKIGVMAATFRQSRGLFEKMDDILAKPEAQLGAACCTHRSKQPDMWKYDFGDSSIVALPMGSGEKLRGFRFNVIAIDEFLLMPSHIFNEVLMPFLSVVRNPDERASLDELETKLIAEGKMKEEDRHQWPNNKFIALSSASYKFEYLYELYCQFEQSILQGETKDEYGQAVRADDVTRCLFHLSYDQAPKKLYDVNAIAQAKSTMSEAQFNREFGAQFLDDSSGYFKFSTMEGKCSPPNGQMTEIVGEAGARYVISVDPSWSESDSSDHFAIQVLKLIPETDKATLVHSFAMPSQNVKVYLNYFYYVVKAFRPVLIVMDYMGGSQFINTVNESAKFINENINFKTIDNEIEFDEDYDKCLRRIKAEYNAMDNRIVMLRKPGSKWIRDANELLQANFDHCRILFGAEPDENEYKKQMNQKPDLTDLVFDNTKTIKSLDEHQKKIDFIEIQKSNIDLTKTQCAMIEVSTTDKGTQTFGFPSALKKIKGPNKPRKDSYSALVLGSWGVKIYNDMNSDKVAKSMETFKPFIINRN